MECFVCVNVRYDTQSCKTRSPVLFEKKIVYSAQTVKIQQIQSKINNSLKIKVLLFYINIPAYLSLSFPVINAENFFGYVHFCTTRLNNIYMRALEYLDGRTSNNFLTKYTCIVVVTIMTIICAIDHVWT